MSFLSAIYRGQKQRAGIMQRRRAAAGAESQTSGTGRVTDAEPFGRIRHTASPSAIRVLAEYEHRCTLFEIPFCALDGRGLVASNAFETGGLYLPAFEA